MLLKHFTHIYTHETCMKLGKTVFTTPVLKRVYELRG